MTKQTKKNLMLELIWALVSYVTFGLHWPVGDYLEASFLLIDALNCTGIELTGLKL